MTATTRNQPIHTEDNRFIQRTNIGNFKIHLNKQNIIDIALIKHGYGVNQDLKFKVFDKIEGLLHGLDEYIKDNNEHIPLVVVFYNRNHWSTLMVCKTENAAHYINHYKTLIPSELKDQIKLHKIILDDSKLFEDVTYEIYDSGIIALETAVALYNNKEQLRHGNYEEVFRNILPCNPSDMIKKRKSLASCLQIMQIQKTKLSTLSNNVTKVLKKINHEKAVDFNYCNANVFLHFLETIALQDLRMKDIEPEYKKYLMNIINLDDVDSVANIRSKLIVHREKGITNIIKPEHLKKLINNPNLKDIFVNIAEYVNSILSIMKQDTSISNKVIKHPKDFLKTGITKIGDDIEQDEYSKEIDRHLEKFLIKAFISPSYSNDILSHDEENQCIFDLIVNFAPYFDNAFNKQTEFLHKIRNIQIHEFYRYSDERFAIEYALTNFLRENKNSLFKCCYSRYVYPMLQDFNKALEKKKNNKENIEENKEKLCNSLVSFLGIHATTILKQQSDQNQRTCVITQNKNHENTHDAFTCTKVSQNHNISKIKDIVEDYFKLLLFIANEDTKYRTNADSEDEDIKRRYKNLNVEQMLQIKNNLTNLQSLEQSTKSEFKNDYKTFKESLQQQFKTDYGIMEEDFDSIVKLTVNWDDIQVEDYNGHIYNICSLIEIINKQQNEYKCSVKDILNMYRERRDLSFSKGSLEEKISSLPQTKICEVHILFKSSNPQRKITRKINPDKFVAIIYEIIKNESRKPISNDINDIFNDCEFLDYLGKNDIFFPNLMKECLDLMIPVYARIISLPNYSISMKDLGLCNALKKLVDKVYIIHLKPIIIKVCNKKGNQNLKTKFMELISTCILENYNDTKNIEYLDNILGDADFANDILGIYLEMSEDINVNAIITKILDSLVGTCFTIACDFKNYDRCLDLLTKENVNKAVSKLKPISQEIYWSVNLNIARLQYKTNNNKECLNILKNMINTTITQELKPFYFLSLSFMAKIQNKEGHYEEAFNNYRALYIEIVEYILCDTPTEFNIHVYNDIVNHERYKTALKISSKYLEILRIRCDMAFSKCEIDNNNEQNYIDALNIYKEVHKIQCVILDKIDEQLIKTKRRIGYVSFRLGIKMGEIRKLNEAEYYYAQALKYNEDVYNLQKCKYWETHPAVKKSLEYVRNTRKKMSIIRREIFNYNCDNDHSRYGYNHCSQNNVYNNYRQNNYNNNYRQNNYHNNYNINYRQNNYNNNYNINYSQNNYDNNYRENSYINHSYSQNENQIYRGRHKRIKQYHWENI